MFTTKSQRKIYLLLSRKISKCIIEIPIVYIILPEDKRMIEKRLNSKKRKELIGTTAERLAEIFRMQIEWNKRNKKKETNGETKI